MQFRDMILSTSKEPAGRNMRFTAIFLVLTVFVFAAFGQKAPQTKKAVTTKPQTQKTAKTAGTNSGKTQAKTKTPAKAAPKKPSTAKTTRPKPAAVVPKPDDKAEFEAASGTTDALERVNALKKFVVNFPKSERIAKARELLVVARAAVADEKLRSGEADASIALFKLAVEESPDPIPEKLFSEVISKFPYSLYFNGQRDAAIGIATAIESRSATNVAQLVSLANFYVSTENGNEAMRIADAATKLDPNSSPAYQALGLAHRLNFELDESAKAYSKALELDPDSMNSRQSLAEMNRALGKPEEAEKLYREMLAAKADDLPAQTGLILSLFDSGKRSDAETELAKSLETTPKNVILLAGAAYWYAANGNADKAIELGEKAVEIEPRYVWSHIALARGLMAGGKPVDAERALIRARSYGNFPTVEYEIASARLASGFYREAAEELQKHFVVSDGMIKTKLGGRIEREGKDFADLIAAERKASIFESSGGNDSATDEKLKQLLELHQDIDMANADQVKVAAAADSFASGDDPMKVHRQLYAASLLLQKNIALDKVVDLSRAATGNTDAGLQAQNAGAAIMASELYDSRVLAFSRNEFLDVPDVPRSTLSAILRGRVEDIAGWALYQQSNYPDAIVRLRRAISVLPDKSAWWRGSMWHLGAALAADGKEKEALDSYIQSYKTDKPNVAKYLVVESLYKRVNGSSDGIEKAIGAERVFVEKEAAPEKVEGATPATATPAEAKTEAVAEPPAIPPAEPAIVIEPKAEEPKIPKGVPVDRTIEALKIEPKTDSAQEKSVVATPAATTPPNAETTQLSERAKIEE
jgi:tetratricopeptide (TPR) repeat protein